MARNRIIYASQSVVVNGDFLYRVQTLGSTTTFNSTDLFERLNRAESQPALVVEKGARGRRRRIRMHGDEMRSPVAFLQTGSVGVEFPYEEDPSTWATLDLVR